MRRRASRPKLLPIALGRIQVQASPRRKVKTMRRSSPGKKLIVWLIALLGVAFLTFWMFAPLIVDR